MADKQLSWAVAHINKFNPQYKLYSDYYNGKHASLLSKNSEYDSVFRQVFGNFADNLCPVVVDTLSDRLQIAGIVSDNETANQLIAQLWSYNKLKRKVGNIHAETLRNGDCFVLVWMDAAGNPKLYKQKSSNIAVRYDAESETIVEAIKSWAVGDRVRVTRYLPDRTERYISKGSTLPESLSELTPYSDDGYDAVIPNPYNRVPIFHFSNSQDFEEFAQSELRDVVPIQNALNKSILDMMIGEEFQSLPQRWITGIEQQIDPTTGKPIELKSGAGKVWEISNPDAKLGSFEAASLQQFLNIHDSFRMEIARVSRTPVHSFLLDSGNFPSGEALKTAEAPLLGKVNDRQIIFGETWEEIFQFACEIANVDPGAITCNWENTAPHSDKEQSETMLNKQALGVSKQQLLRELGYSESEIEKMDEENQIDSSMLVEKALTSFNAGN